jgi:hypothetical protein
MLSLHEKGGNVELIIGLGMAILIYRCAREDGTLTIPFNDKALAERVFRLIVDELANIPHDKAVWRNLEAAAYRLQKPVGQELNDYRLPRMKLRDLEKELKAMASKSKARVSDTQEIIHTLFKRLAEKHDSKANAWG